MKDDTPGGLNTAHFVLSLPKTKADPDPKQGKGYTDRIASTDGKRYWLDVNRRRPPYSPEDMVRMGVPRLPRFFSALAGQDYVKWKLVSEITATLANQEAYHRMVFVLGGPPGHGKTMAAKELCCALGGENAEQDFLKVSCANLNSPFELFGGSGCYQGSQTGSELNNFVVSHRDRLGVVNLDEFDRLSPETSDALFTIFDKGEWVDKKLSSAYQTKTLSCSKIVWILTTNTFDEKIINFFEKEKTEFEGHNFKSLERKIEKKFKGDIEKRFGCALARRLGPLIPFVPFNVPECIAFIERDLDENRISYAKPPPPAKAPIRLVSNFEFKVDCEVVAYVARDAYDKNQGATSIKDFVFKDIYKCINQTHMEGEPVSGSRGRFSLAGEDGEEMIKFQLDIEESVT